MKLKGSGVMIPQKREKHLQTLIRRLNINLTNLEQLSIALTHPSFLLEEEGSHALINNQRLEFLGDAVVDLIVGQFLYETFPDKPEGELTKMRAALVCESSLANAARRVSLGEYLLFGANKIFSLTTPVNLDLVLNVLLCGLLIFVALVVVCSALYFVVEKSVAAVTYKESTFDTDFRFGEFFKQILPDVLFSVLTLGLYAPWFLTRLVRYFSRRIVHGGNVLEFEGKPMMLFNISVLLYVLPMVVYEIAMKEVTERFAEDQSMLLFWSVLLLGLFFVAISLYTTGVYSKWLLKGWYGNRRLVSTASMWDGGWFVFGQLFLSLIQSHNLIFLYNQVVMEAV